jgi:hypothetical protein
MGLLVESGSDRVTEADVYAVPVPEPTRRHHAIPHSYLIGTVRDVFQSKFPEFELVDEQYALGGYSRETGLPGQMFGVHTYNTNHPTFGLSIGFRNSYNSSFAAGVVGGCNPMRKGILVCSNLCFSGDSFKVNRKNTYNGMTDLYNMVLNNAYAMLDDYRKMTREFDVLEAIPVDQEGGYEILGHMYGQKMIKKNQLSVAYDAWDNPPQEEWAPRNALSLYNAVTEATKKTTPFDVVGDLRNTHQYFKKRFNVEEMNKQLEEVC